MTQAFIEKWAAQLSIKLQRSAEDIVRKGLSCRDFRAQVEIKFRDKSQALFYYAFFVVDTETKTCAVFTEHCGYFEFSSSAVMIKEVSEHYFVDDLYEDF